MENISLVGDSEESDRDDDTVSSDRTWYDRANIESELKKI